MSQISILKYGKNILKMLVLLAQFRGNIGVSPACAGRSNGRTSALSLRAKFIAVLILRTINKELQ